MELVVPHDDAGFFELLLVVGDDLAGRQAGPDRLRQDRLDPQVLGPELLDLRRRLRFAVAQHVGIHADARVRHDVAALDDGILPTVAAAALRLTGSHASHDRQFGLVDPGDTWLDRVQRVLEQPDFVASHPLEQFHLARHLMVGVVQHQPLGRDQPARVHLAEFPGKQQVVGVREAVDFAPIGRPRAQLVLEVDRDD